MIKEQPAPTGVIASFRFAFSSPARLRKEVLGGLAVALALIPEVLSFSILAGLDPRARGERWATIIEQMPPAQRTRVAVHRASGEVVGFVTVDTARDDDPATPTARTAYGTSIVRG